MRYLEHYEDAFAFLCGKLQHANTKLGELDSSMNGTIARLQKQLPATNGIKSLNQLIGELLGISEQKIKIASDAYETIHRQIETINSDLERIEKGIGRSTRAATYEAAAGDGAEVEAAALLSEQNDLEIVPPQLSTSPGEPKYCYCGRVSFGEMIACDNEKCDVEWFHYECVGLKQPPKGRWYCNDCLGKRKRTAAAA